MFLGVLIERLDAGAKEFADANLPALQPAVSEIDKQFTIRQQQIDNWRTLLRGKGEDPEQDESTKSWQKAINDLAAMRNGLIEKRDAAYKEYARYEFAPDAGDSSKLDKLLAPAKEETEHAVAMLKQLPK